MKNVIDFFTLSGSVAHIQWHTSVRVAVTTLTHWRVKGKWVRWTSNWEGIPEFCRGTSEFRRETSEFGRENIGKPLT